MVSASASGKKKKKVKKSAKRKPVNLQSNFARKCISASAGMTSPSKHASISADMFPTNHNDDSGQHHHHNRNDAHDDTGDCSCGDFHLHSICSDGKLKPSEVIEKAAANGVTYMSLTDHDTMAGVAEAMETAKRLDVLVFPGVEISAEVKGGENLHILGYFYPGSNSVELEAQLEKIRTGRHKRGKGMLSKLASMGIKLEWDRVLEIAGEAAPGRPHVAQALVEGGFVPNFREAFNRYLHNNGPAYVEGEHFPPEEAIKLIASAGGVSVLAHPWCCKNPLTLVPELAKLGIQGIEVYHDISKIDTYGYLATESGLLKMGGSDFHGIDPNTECAPGGIPFPRKQVEAFLAHAKSVWERPLTERLRAMIDTAKQLMQQQINGNAQESVEELLVWREQLDMAQQTCAALGAELEVLEDESSTSQYRTLRVHVS
uniref:Polymerase/histidinol phosphatase N-terminal domain-containing protein n=1 Tax=Globisporangium ultimum (strain ATCC 200006 / CBS 805.95 / DAOM BR144) TaxID=431595 RepID=K3WUC7_GLOUD